MKTNDQPEQLWNNQMEEMEVARERGRINYALEGFSVIRSKAENAGDMEAAGLATAHIVVCHKHLFQNTGMTVHREQMETELRRGLNLPLSDSLKAVFLMRYSDVECERRKFERADSFCQQAHELIERNSYEEAECLSRWGYAKTMLGNLADAESLFARSAKVSAGFRGSRTFRRITLDSGLIARQLQLLLVQKHYASALLHFCHGYFLAWESRLRYGMPQRVKQYHRAIIAILSTASAKRVRVFLQLT